MISGSKCLGTLDQPAERRLMEIGKGKVCTVHVSICRIMAMI